MHLTDLSIRTLRPPERGQKDYFDDALRGFGVRISQGGSRSFFLVTGTRQHRQRISIGRYPTVRLADARVEAKRILAERMLAKTQIPEVTYAEAVETYFKICEQKNRVRTLKDKRRLLGKHFPFHDRPLQSIRSPEVATRIDALLETPSEAYHAFSEIRAFFRWCVSRTYLEASPISALRAPITNAPRERVLSADELKKVANTARGSGVFGKIVLLCLLLGQRRGEIGALRGEYIDREKRTITLPATLCKNRRQHTFPYGPIAASILNDLPTAGWCFPGRGSEESFNGWSKCKEAFDRRCPIAHWTLHDLRRTFATNLAELGIPPHVTERYLNHVSGTVSGITAIYNRYAYMPEMKLAAESWEERLTFIVGGTEIARASSHCRNETDRRL